MFTIKTKEDAIKINQHLVSKIIKITSYLSITNF